MTRLSVGPFAVAVALLLSIASSQSPPAPQVPEVPGRLHEAAAAGDVEAIRQALAAGADANAILFQRTPLYEVAAAAVAEGIEVLLAAGADPDVLCVDGETALHRAATYGTPAGIRALLRGKAKPTIRDRNQRTALHAAAYHESSDNLRAMLEAIDKPDLESRDKYGETPLMIAASVGNADSVALLLGLGADARTQASGDITALARALELTAPVPRIVQSLLAAGSVPDGAKLTPLMVAVLTGEERAVEGAVNGADLQAKCHGGHTALMLAAIVGKAPAMRRLLAAGAKLGVVDSKGHTALHRAAASGDLECVTMLLQQGAKVDARTRSGMTPLMLAARPGAVAIVRALIEAGAAKDAATPSGLRASHLAARNGDAAVIGALAAAGTDLATANRADQYPLGIAIEANRLDLVQALLAAGAPVRPAAPLPPPSYLAAGWRADAAILGLLIERGAAVDATNELGESALHHAARHGTPDKIRLLLAGSADREARASGDFTPLYAAIGPSTSSLQLRTLLAAGVAKEAKTRAGATPLLWAARHGTLQQVADLLGAGADVRAVDGAGQGVLHYAVQSVQARPWVVRALLAAGAEPGATDTDGNTAAALAARIEDGPGKAQVLALLPPGR